MSEFPAVEITGAQFDASTPPEVSVHHFLCPAREPENVTDSFWRDTVCECELIDKVYQHSAQVLAGYVVEKSVEAYASALRDVREAVNATYMQTKPWNTLTVSDVIYIVDQIEEKSNGRDA